MEITPTYVTFDQAKKLKEKGYPQLNKGLYYTKDKEHCLVGWGFNDRTENSFAQYSTPEQWQVIEWLRLKYGLWIAIDVDCRDFFDTNLLFFFRICNIGENLKCLYISQQNLKYFEYPDKATSAAIDYVLENLI